MNLVKKLSKILPSVTAEAHCDVPCGIYDPTPAKIAAKTVQRMVLQIKELKPGDHDHDISANLEYTNAIQRRITTKEKHAQLCKDELSILWSDYFKPEHLEKYPDLHQKFWNALKLCSKNKQAIDEESSKKLIEAVDEIAKIFYETKNDPERFSSYQKITDKLF
ncbi:MAG: superoxide dismutase, Ni [Anaplasmataceae bacterium]|nr:superoxide dismutase, Ni [Anaplasmataceae bacterium]